MKEYFLLQESCFVILGIKVIVNLLYGYVLFGSNLAPVEIILFTKKILPKKIIARARLV